MIPIGRDKAIEEIAARELDIRNLVSRENSRTQKYECTVYSLKEALRQAYEAGVTAGRNIEIGLQQRG